MINCNKKAKLSNGIMHTCAANFNMHYTMAVIHGQASFLTVSRTNGFACALAKENSATAGYKDRM
jgi:hypothetical protein